MAVELEHSFSTSKPIDETYVAILDLEQVIPCVEGATVLEVINPTSVSAEITVKAGAIPTAFVGTVEIVEEDADTHTVLMTVESTVVDGEGQANANLSFALTDGGCTIRTSAEVTGPCASMGEEAVARMLDVLIKDFSGKLAAL
jgi:carbon monoxide dehydrogenase subunit G